LLSLATHLAHKLGEALRVCEGKSSARSLKTMYVAASVISQDYSGKRKEKKIQKEIKTTTTRKPQLVVFMHINLWLLFSRH